MVKIKKFNPVEFIGILGPLLIIWANSISEPGVLTYPNYMAAVGYFLSLPVFPLAAYYFLHGNIYVIIFAAFINGWIYNSVWKYLKNTKRPVVNLIIIVTILLLIAAGIIYYIANGLSGMMA